MLSPRKLFVQEIKEKIPRIIFFLLWILKLGSRNRGVGHVTPGPLWPPVLSSVNETQWKINRELISLFF